MPSDGWVAELCLVAACPAEGLERSSINRGIWSPSMEQRP